MTEVTAAIRTALSQAEPLRATSAYFGTTVMPTSGALAGCVVTAYRGGRDPGVQELLVRRHEAYVDCLRLGGVRVPQTELRLLDDAGSQFPVMVQRAISPSMMMGPMMRDAKPDGAIDLLDAVATDVAEFWRRVAQRPERIGLHAQLERFAMGDDGPVFLETFPPLISYNRDEVGQLIQRFADSGLTRGLGKILPGRVRDVQDRWYTPAGSLTTLIDGAMRLRPDDHEMIAEWVDGFAARRLEEPWRSVVLKHVSRHRRTGVQIARRWGGLIGGRDRPHA